MTYYIQIYCVTERIPHGSYLIEDLMSGAGAAQLEKVGR